MSNDYLLNITIIEAISWPTIIRYLLVLIVEIVACIFLTSRIDRDHQRVLRLRVIGLMLGLFVAGFFLQTPELYCLWFIIVVAATGTLANTKLGFGYDEIEPISRIKISKEFRNLVVWLALIILAYSIGVGSSFLAAIVRDPVVVQEEVRYIFHEKDGGLLIVLDEGEWGIDVHVSKHYTSYFSEGECLELIYSEFYVPPESFERYATKIQRTESCE